jgi:hypothetical protein
MSRDGALTKLMQVTRNRAGGSDGEFLGVSTQPRRPATQTEQTETTERTERATRDDDPAVLRRRGRASESGSSVTQNRHYDQSRHSVCFS